MCLVMRPRVLRDGASSFSLCVPVSGKTSLVRDLARLLAAQYNVCIVDTSNEIAGGYDVRHSSVGQARRIMVPSLAEQAKVMVHCVQVRAKKTSCKQRLTGRWALPTCFTATPRFYVYESALLAREGMVKSDVCHHFERRCQLSISPISCHHCTLVVISLMEGWRIKMTALISATLSACTA
jgi:hypothetical protein